MKGLLLAPSDEETTLSKSTAKPATSKASKTAKAATRPSAAKKPLTAAKPAKPAKAAAKPASKPNAKPASKAASKPAAKPTAKASAKSTKPTKPMAKAMGKAASKPGGKPSGAQAAKKVTAKPTPKGGPKSVIKAKAATQAKLAPAATAGRASKAQKQPPANKTSTPKKPSPALPAGKLAASSKPSSKAPLKNTPAGKPAPSAPAANRFKTAGPAPVTASSQKASVKSTAAPAKPASAPVQATAAQAPTSAPRGGKTRLSRAEANSQPVPAAPIHPANRFADRFAPAKPSARHLPEPILDTKPAGKPDPKLANAWKSKAGRDLSEPELLAMPDSEYMNDKQIDFFKSRLNALKEDLLSNAGETTEHLREDTTIVPDPADRATIEEEHALELRTRDRERKLLRKISQSLARIDAGEYGYCEETGEPIGLGRLLARPTATLSLEAQQRRELKQRMFGD